MPKVRTDGQEDLFIPRKRHPKLEEALEDREKVKASRGALGKKFKDADVKVKGFLEELEIDAKTGVRVGRFIITRTEQGGKTVTFETAPRTVVRIKTED
ncbi:MAG: hypothetical protein ACREDF_10220 [Thermoplasmata archaeon]